MRKRGRGLPLVVMIGDSVIVMEGGQPVSTDIPMVSEDPTSKAASDVLWAPFLSPNDFWK